STRGARGRRALERIANKSASRKRLRTRKRVGGDADPRYLIARNAVRGDLAPASAAGRKALLGLTGGESGLDRLESFGRQLHEQLIDLADLRDETLIGGLGEIGLDLDRRLRRFGAHQLFHHSGALRERLLGVVRRLDGDFLQALRHRE